MFLPQLSACAMRSVPPIPCLHHHLASAPHPSIGSLHRPSSFPSSFGAEVIHLLRFLITSSGPDPPSRPRHVPPPTSPQDPPLQAAAGALPGRRPAGPVAADLGLVRPGPRGPAAGGHGRGLSHALHSVSLLCVPKIRVPKLRVPKIRVPKLQVPTLRVPKLRVPKLRVPKLRVPKLRVPKLRLNSD
jgi:hypothetical protein